MKKKGLRILEQSLMMKLTKKVFIIICLFCASVSFSQECEGELWFNDSNPWSSQEVIETDIINKVDLSPLFTDKRTDFLGYIGENKRRLFVDLSFVKKVDGHKYLIAGKTKVGANNREFRGYLEIENTYQFKEFINGVDDFMKGKILNQGIAVANCLFVEDFSYSSTGIFEGQFVVRWYLTLDNELKYDDITSFSDSYFNNQFYGDWTSYKTGKSSVVAWGHYRIPCSGDLDWGASEFSPNPKYYQYGWEDYEP
ncbi:MAG: hypothetical protein AAF620_19865 [Bacteroidota bacterium]